MEALTEYAERMLRGEATMRGLFADGVAVVPGFANVIAFQTADGLVLVDTGLRQTAQAMFDAVRVWSADPVRYAVFTHGHVDHVSGMAPYDQEAAAKGWQAPVVVAHEAVAARFERYARTAAGTTAIPPTSSLHPTRYWRPRSPNWPAARRPWLTGRGRQRRPGPCDWPATWPNWPRSPSRTTRRCTRCARRSTRPEPPPNHR